MGRCYQFGTGVMGNMKTAVEWYEKALEVIHDPELERKTAMFKMIGENDEHWGEDYPGTDEDAIYEYCLTQAAPVIAQNGAADFSYVLCGKS